VSIIPKRNEIRKAIKAKKHRDKMSGRIGAMTAASAAQSKRKNAPKEDEDDDSSDAGSDVVRLPSYPYLDSMDRVMGDLSRMKHRS
jgi:hypothetical protein